MSVVRAFVRNPDGTGAGQLDIFTQLDCIKRDLDVGSWSISCPTTDTSEVLGTPGYSIQVKIDEEEFIAGPTTTIENNWSPDGATSIISGLSDESRLWEYLCYPSAAPFFTASDYDFQNSAYAETAMKHYVSYNLADSRKPAAVAAIGVGPDRTRGPTGSWQARFETVGDKLLEIATYANLGFRINNLTFDVYERVDRSADQVFSLKSGNLIQFSYKRTRPTANRIIAGGSGDGTSRAFRVGADSVSAATWGAYVESFRDRRDTSDSDKLDQSIVEELAKGAEKNALTLRTIDMENRAYGVDWNLGDTVTAEGVVGTVKQVQLTVNDKGQVIVPFVNSATAVAAPAILRAYDELRAVRRRIAYLERSV